MVGGMRVSKQPVSTLPDFLEFQEQLGRFVSFLVGQGKS